MVDFEVNGKAYKYPLSIEEVTLGQFINYCELEKAQRPPELNELNILQKQLSDRPEEDQQGRKQLSEKIAALWAKIESIEYYETLLSWYAKIVEFWSGLPYAVIMAEDGGPGLKIADLELLAKHLQKLVNTVPEVDYSPVLEFNNELWYMPAPKMKESTVLEYLAASQFYKIEESLAGGQWGALAKVICVLLRKKEEPWNKKLLEREEMFKALPMDKAFMVAFFFSRQMQTYLSLIRTYTTAQANKKLERELKN